MASASCQPADPVLRSERMTPGVKRLKKVLEEKTRLNSTITQRSRRIHNMSKSFRRQTLQENNRNLARALQKYKERQRWSENEMLELKREKQELTDELSSLRQMVGKKDVELNSIVEERVERRLSEIRVACGQISELTNSVIGLCLSDSIHLNNRWSGEGLTEEATSISKDRENHKIERPVSARTCHLAAVSDLSLITEKSFLDQSGFAPLQFADEHPGGATLHTVTELDEERRSRSRGSFRSRRSGLNQDIADDRIRTRRTRSRSVTLRGSKEFVTANATSRGSTELVTATATARGSTELAESTSTRSITECENDRESRKLQEKDVELNSSATRSDRELELTIVTTDSTRSTRATTRLDKELELSSATTRSRKELELTSGTTDSPPTSATTQIQNSTTPRSSELTIEKDNISLRRISLENLKSGSRDSIDQSAASKDESDSANQSASRHNPTIFPGGDRISRTPPRPSSQAHNSSNLVPSNPVTPASNSNTPTPKYEAFHIKMTDTSPKVVKTFSPSANYEIIEKIVKKSTKETFTFISFADDKPKQKAKPKPNLSKSLRIKSTRVRDKDSIRTANESESSKTENESESNKPTHRRRTYSLESKLNTTLEKDITDVKSDVMNDVAKETVTIATVVNDLNVDDLDDSLGLVDATILDNIDMELTGVIDLNSIRAAISENKEAESVLALSDTKPCENSDSDMKPNKRVRKASEKSQNNDDEEFEARRSSRKRNPSGKSNSDVTDLEKVVPEKTRKRNPSARSKQKKFVFSDSDGSISDASDHTETESKQTAGLTNSSSCESLSESATSADESSSAAAFKFYRSKPGKLNFIVGRKDVNGRPQDPIAILKKSKSKSRSKKITSNINLENDGSVFDLTISDAMPLSLDDMRKQKTSSVSDDNADGNLAETAEVKRENIVDKVDDIEESNEKELKNNEERKENDDSLFKIPLSTIHNKRRQTNVINNSETKPEIISQPRSRRTTVVKSYQEYFNSSVDETLPRVRDGKPDVQTHKQTDVESQIRKPEVESQITKAPEMNSLPSEGGDRRLTKLIRRVSSAPKVPRDVITTDDVTNNDTYVVNDTTIGQDDSSIDCDVTPSNTNNKPSDYSRRETPVIKARELPLPDLRRLTHVVPSVSALPGAEVTLPEPEVMPESVGCEIPMMTATSGDEEEELTLDLTKLLKSVNAEKRSRDAMSASMAAVTGDEDDMTLDLTKLLKQVNRQKLREDAAAAPVDTAVTPEHSSAATPVLSSAVTPALNTAVTPVPVSAVTPVHNDLNSCNTDVRTKNVNYVPKSTQRDGKQQVSHQKTAIRKKESVGRPMSPAVPGVAMKRLTPVRGDTVKGSKIAKRRTRVSDIIPSHNIKKEIVDCESRSPLESSRARLLSGPVDKSIKKETKSAIEATTSQSTTQVNKPRAKRTKTPKNSKTLSATSSVEIENYRTSNSPCNERSGENDILQEKVNQASTMKKVGGKVNRSRISGEVENMDCNDESICVKEERLSFVTSPKRPRRTQAVSYKEPSLHVKMRRDENSESLRNKVKKKSSRRKKSDE